MVQRHCAIRGSVTRNHLNVEKAPQPLIPSLFRMYALSVPVSLLHHQDHLPLGISCPDSQQAVKQLHEGVKG